MEFITTGNRIAVENFEIGYFYTITMLSGNYFQACCTGIGSDFVMFSRDEPDLLFSLTIQSAADVSSIELYGGGSGTNDYNDLSNKPQLNGVTLIGNKSLSDLGIQETISDLDTIRSGAAAGATAVQPADLATALATKQDTISDLNTIRSGAAAGATAVQPAAMSAALETKQDTLSSAQLAAVNSGIDSTKVAQIETNKNNILYNTKNGVSNVLPLNTVYVKGVHADVTNPSKIHFYGTSDSSGTLSGLSNRMTLKEGAYIITVDTDFDTSLNIDIYLYDSTLSTTILALETSGTYEFTANPAHEYFYAFFFNQGVTVDFNYQVNVRPKNSPDVGFQPYAPSNAELYAMIQALQSQLNQ